MSNNNDNFLPRFQRLMLAASEVFSKEVTQSHAQVFLNLLSDYDISDVEQAFLKHMKTAKFFPVPADIISLIPSKKSDQFVIDGDRKLKRLN